LNEIAEEARRKIIIDENLVPVREDVHAACELLGLDPWQVACEGRFVAFVPGAAADQALTVMRRHEGGTGAARIGEVEDGQPPLVVLKNAFGASRILDMASGEQLPRIC
jgi:hydrogenase expression/formation protein HypE